MSAVVLFVLFFVILLFGLPISVTMGISSILPWVVDNTFAANLVMVLRQMMSGVNSLTLLAIPMFMLSGTIMARGGISKKLFDVFTYFVGNVIGGVPCAVIITCLFYGAISGSAPATVAAVGAMTIPVMVNLGYSKEFSTAVVTVAGGTYGWEVDKDALLALVKDGVANGAANTVDIPCTQTGDAYNGAGSRDWGARYMDVDLSEQHARLYDASGAVIWESDIITGKPDGEHDTPTGVYMVNAKQSPSKLIGYNGNEKIYETEVQYWMPFVGNYIGFHDADWQPAFGGTLYADGVGSHGCVNLPPSKAAELYGMLSSGDTVVSHW